LGKVLGQRGHFSGDALVLGKYFGPSIDVGLDMTQRILKANGEIEDRSTVCSLTPKEGVNAALYQEQETFLEAVQEMWGQNMMIKNLGPDVLNLVPNLENNKPWEDDDGPSFPKLDDELDIAKSTGDFLVNTEVLFPVGTPRNL
jgi:hypothetical protein